jgi:hypothetical protein
MIAIRTILAFTLFTLLGLTTSALGQSVDDQMKAAVAGSQPGPAHDVLKLFTGKWKSTITAHFDPNHPTKGTGSTTNTMIMGGRFLQMQGDGTLMGLKVANMQIIGYDTRKNKYFSFSIDELGTYAVTAEGDYDAATRTLTLNGVEEQGAMKMNFKVVMKIIDKNTFSSSVVFDIPGQGEMTMVEQIFTKA